LAQAARRLQEALERHIIREGEVTPARVRAVLEGFGRRLLRAPEGEASDLRESLQRFLAAAREAGGREGLVLAQGAERALASVEFLQAANALRGLLDQGAFLQIPYAWGGERGTVDVVVRRGGKRSGGGEAGRESYSVVFLLDLQGLGPLRIDASLIRNRASVRFTTPSAEVGKFLDLELPKLREAIESHEIRVEGLSWAQGRVQPEPVVPAGPGGARPEGSSLIDLQV